VAQRVSFTVAAVGTSPLSFQWQRNQVNIPGANASTYTIDAALLTDSGAKFRCVVTNSFGNATSNEATLTVSAPAPVIVTEENTNIAIALDSVNMIRDPFALTNLFNFAIDGRTRLMLFCMNVDLLPGETSSAVTATAEDAQLNIYPAPVEFVGKVSGFDWLSEVVVKLPDNLPPGQTIRVSVTLRGQTSNKATFRTK
jgi:uncharacterized protein (TIGR03437 family)